MSSTSTSATGNHQSSPSSNSTHHTYRQPSIAPIVAPGSSSPKAPAYSPITPKVQPVLPVPGQTQFVPPDNGANFTFLPPPPPPPRPQPEQQTAMIPPSEYMPPPPTQPFTDSTDASALRAAISSLQIQAHTARNDIEKLKRQKQAALANPDAFSKALAAGEVRQQQRTLGDFSSLTAHLDDEAEADSDDSDADEEKEEDDGVDNDAMQLDAEQQHTSVSTEARVPKFERLPGAQVVVRMPPINWNKYGIVGEPLDVMHEQQRHFPGTSGFGVPKGPPPAVAKPYSPLTDHIEGGRPAGEASRKDSGAASTSVSPTS